MEPEWELCEMSVVCDTKPPGGFMVRSRSAFLGGATEARGIFEQKDPAFAPQREETPVLCGLFFSRYLSETEESSIQGLSAGTW